MKNSIVFIRANSFRSEPRLIKEYEAAKKLDRFLILWNRDNIVEPMTNSYILKLKSPFGNLLFILSLPIWFIFVIIQLFRIRPDIMHACDMDCVVPAYCYRCLRPQTKLVYDIWDATIGHFPTRNKLLRNLIVNAEKYFIYRSDLVLLPDRKRMTQLGIKGTKLENNVLIILNSDRITNKKRTVQLKKKKLIVSYVGVMSRNIRGLEQMIYAAQRLPDISFEIAGYGPDQNYLTKMFKRVNLDNLHFLGRLSHKEAEQLNKSSDIMMILLDKKFENYIYATSTKLFEAFKLLKPVIASKGSATGDMVDKYAWGAVIEYDQDSLLDCLSKISSGKISFTLDSKKVSEYDWRIMERKLSDAYDRLSGNLP